MTILDRMILKRLLVRTAAIFLFVAVVIMTTQVMAELSRVVESAGGLFLFFRLVSVVFPMVLVSVLPVSFLVAMLTVYAGMNEDRESAVIMATGVSPARFLRPAGGLALVLSGLVLVFSLFVEPVANRALQTLLEEVRIGALKLIAADGNLRQVTPGIYAQAGKLDAEGQAEGVFILDRRDREHQMLFLARRGGTVTGPNGPLLELTDGEVLLMDPRMRGPHVARFGRFEAATSTLLPGGHVSVGPVQAPTEQLLGMVRSADATPSELALARAELMRRVTDWLWPLAFFAGAAWVAVVSAHRDAPRFVMLRALAIIVTARLLAVVLLGSSGSSLIAAAGTLLVPVAIYAGFSHLLRQRSAPGRSRTGTRGAG